VAQECHKIFLNAEISMLCNNKIYSIKLYIQLKMMIMIDTNFVPISGA